MMGAMKPPTVSQLSAAEPQRTDTTETGTAETTMDTLHIEHTKLPSLGSGPIFPFSWLIGLFRRKDTPAAR
jgi:hypothetical protein